MVRAVVGNQEGGKGVSLTTAQKLARHSDPKLTANTHTHLAMHDHMTAVELLLPPLEPEPPRAMRCETTWSAYGHSHRTSGPGYPQSASDSAWSRMPAAGGIELVSVAESRGDGFCRGADC